MLSGNWAGDTSPLCGWPGTFSMDKNLHCICCIHCCVLRPDTGYQTNQCLSETVLTHVCVLLLWLQGEEVCGNEGGEERRALHRDSGGRDQTPEFCESVELCPQRTVVLDHDHVLTPSVQTHRF